VDLRRVEFVARLENIRSQVCPAISAALGNICRLDSASFAGKHLKRTPSGARNRRLCPVTEKTRISLAKLCFARVRAERMRAFGREPFGYDRQKKLRSIVSRDISDSGRTAERPTGNTG